jgi:hypothetical protein
MNRTWKLLCLPALLVGLLTASSVRATDPELDKSDTKKILERLDRMQDELIKMRQDLARQQDDNDRRQRLNDTRDTILEQRLKILEDRLAEIERAAKARIANYPTGPGSTSGYFNPSDTIVGPPTTATVRMQNNSPFVCTVTVNGIMQRVAPGQLATWTVPSGLFSYDVFSEGYGFLRRNTLTISANATRDMAIY